MSERATRSPLHRPTELIWIRGGTFGWDEPSPAVTV